MMFEPDSFEYSLFERWYAAFMQAGGFDRPAVREDLEREQRQHPKRPPEHCPHGKTKLTCAICYLSDGWGWGRGN